MVFAAPKAKLATRLISASPLRHHPICALMGMVEKNNASCPRRFISDEPPEKIEAAPRMLAWWCERSVRLGATHCTKIEL
jgi:hypothetical protein